MIDVNIFRNENHGIRLDISGHATHGEEHADLVCAAVSSVFYSLCGYLYNFCKDNLKIYSLTNGHADIECGIEGEEAMKMALLGIWQLALGYPQHVHVSNRAFFWKMRSCIDVSI